MNDMSMTIIPKSDQISADDLIAGPRTITITAVTITPGEQPVTVSFHGDEGRPWKPCKSMCRVLVHGWGRDANLYVGKAVTIYRDPTVKWGGMEVGGIRVSHMSDIASQLNIPLTATRGSKKVTIVKPLVAKKTAIAQSPAQPPNEDELPLDAAMAAANEDATAVLTALALCRTPRQVGLMQTDYDPELTRLLPFPTIHKQVTDQIEAKRQALLTGPSKTEGN